MVVINQMRVGPRPSQRYSFSPSLALSRTLLQLSSSLQSIPMHVAPPLLSLLVPVVAVALESQLAEHVAVWLAVADTLLCLGISMVLLHPIESVLSPCLEAYVGFICTIAGTLPYSFEERSHSGIAGLSDRHTDKRSLVERTWLDACKVKLARSFTRASHCASLWMRLPEEPWVERVLRVTRRVCSLTT